jgi:hypothetical protein
MARFVPARLPANMLSFELPTSWVFAEQGAGFFPLSRAVFSQPSKLAAAIATPVTNAPTQENRKNSLRILRMIPPSHELSKTHSHLGKKVSADCRIWDEN